MRILITADTHLVWKYTPHVLDAISRHWDGCQPDALVIAGDIATADDGRKALGQLRGATSPNASIALCTGNHDYWTANESLRYSADKKGRRVASDLEHVLSHTWVRHAREFGIHILDQQNLILKDVAIVGGYGHYDLSFRQKHLAAKNGRLISSADYLAGGVMDEDWQIWNDILKIPSKRGILKEAKRQAALISERVKEAAQSNLPILLAVHTPPFAELLGYQEPFLEWGDAFCLAYRGNSLVGKAIIPFANQISLLVTGHTHRCVPPKIIHGIQSLNVGSDYCLPKFWLYDTVEKSIKEVTGTF